MADSFARLADDIEACRRCDRLVHWRESVASSPRRAHAGEPYWARGVPGFGDPDAALVLVGLAPGAHGSNRTGRMFTGDRSGEWLYRALFDAGYANQPVAIDRHDDMVLSGVYITAAVRCAPPQNKPTPLERECCSDYLERELAMLTSARVLVALGAFALDALARHFEMRPRPAFAHLAEHEAPDGRLIVCSYHPSQQNTFTGKLTRPMFDAVFSRARELGV